MIFPQSQIAASVKAAVVLAIQSNLGDNPEFLRGVLAVAQHQAISFQLDWLEIVDELAPVVRENGISLLDEQRHCYIEGRLE